MIRDGADPEVVALGARTFDVPETAKERTPTNQLRRRHRLLRRVLRRRSRRMSDLRRLFCSSGLIDGDHSNALKAPGLDPWRLRAEGLDRRLTGRELAVALGHVAKHRGFKSNSKRDRGANAPDESSKMLKSISATRERLSKYRTIGEMFATDPDYAGRKRNRDGDYTRSILRDDQEHEVGVLFELQRRMGNPLATADLERGFVDVAFFQRPLADSEDKVGDCPFEPSEKRAARRSHSFELFRFLSRLAALRIQTGREERALTADEVSEAAHDFGAQKGMTFARLRKRLALGDGERFEGCPADEEGKRDVVNRSSSNGCAQGSAALRGVIGEAGWRSLLATPEKLDRIAFVLSFREDIGSIGRGLAEIGLEPLVLDALKTAVDKGAIDFGGAGHVSAKACRAMIPHLMRGIVYSEAAREAGYDHARRAETDLEAIGNPIARKAITEALKQVRAIVQEYGLPGRIHVELARDVGKSKEERDEIASGIERRNKEKDRLRQQFAEDVGVEPAGGEDLLRYELWREQRGKSLYTDDPIPVGALVSSDRTVEVDHILPWSRSGDDSFFNKTLCFARENQDKKGRTPFEWFGHEEARWAAFDERVETSKGMHRQKRKNYRLQNASVLEEKFKPRNLNDTRFATRVVLELLARLYPTDGKLRVRARPGRLTDKLRRGWGLQTLKKNEAGVRVADDRHHALDALIVAATSEAELQKLTKAFQEAERIGSRRDFSRLEPPWPGFVAETGAKLKEVFVSRAERRRARGEGHAATIRRVDETDGATLVSERKSVDAITLDDLKRAKDPERNAHLIENVRAWIVANKPKGAPPLSPKGDPIRKLRLTTKIKPGLLVRDGAADRGEMVRVDVFRKPNKKGAFEYFLVPIYPHQIFDEKDWPAPPNRAISAFKDESDWYEMTSDYEFIWSLYPFSFVMFEKTDGRPIKGYFRGLHRGTGNISVSLDHSNNSMIEGLGPRRLKGFKKFAVDRLGNRFEIPRETRTWRGAACT